MDESNKGISNTLCSVVVGKMEEHGDKGHEGRSDEQIVVGPVL